MKKTISMLATIIILLLATTACGAADDVVSPSTDFSGGESEVNSSFSTSVDTNADTSATTTYEQVSVDPRIGKTLGELMDLSAYLEECNTLDVYKDNARELSDVLPFEIYEIFESELINFYADGSGTKTVKAASIEGTYGTPMIIKMDGSDTFDMVVRATSDRYTAYDSCTFASLVDFKVIQVNLTKEEIEGMFNEYGELKEEYRPLLQGSAGDPHIGLTLNDYISMQNNAPKYYVFNNNEYLDELINYDVETILDAEIILVYFGEYPIPLPGDEIVIVSTYFEGFIGYTNLEDIIEIINNSNIREVIVMPDTQKALIEKYAGYDSNAENGGALEVGKTLSKSVDLTAYDAIIDELESMNDYSRDVTDVLPFEMYSVAYEGIYLDNVSGLIPGFMDDVMVVKMNGASTYAILLKMPYESDGLYNACSFKDLGNYKVIANELAKEEVERMVSQGGYLNSDYGHLVYEYSVLE